MSELEVREELLYELETLIKVELCELTTLDLEKLYTRFVINRTADIGIVLKQEAI
jgi:hypothetical protein